MGALVSAPVNVADNQPVTLTIPGLIQQQQHEPETQYDDDEDDQVPSEHEYQGDDLFVYHADVHDDISVVNDTKHADVIVREFRAFIHRRLMEKAVRLVPIQEMLDLRPTSGHGFDRGHECHHIHNGIDWHQYSSTFDVDNGSDLYIISRDYNVNNDESANN